MMQSWFDVFVTQEAAGGATVSSHHFFAPDRGEAAERALRKRFGFRSRLLRDGRVARVDRHGRTRRVVAEGVRVEVNEIEGE